MTAGLFVSGTPAVRGGPPVGQEAGDPAGLVTEVIHAVAKPVVDGLEASVCGLLVTAAAGNEWPSAGQASRCEECSRIAG